MEENCFLDNFNDINKCLCIILAVLYITGVINNVFTKIILARKGVQSELDKLFIILSAWDFLFLLSLLGEGLALWLENGSLVGIKDPGYIWISVGCDINQDWNTTGGWCEIRDNWASVDRYVTGTPSVTSYILYSIAKTFQMASIFQTVVVATFRCIVLRCPFRAEELCNECRAFLASAICFLLAVIIHIPWYLVIPLLQLIWECDNTNGCILLPDAEKSSSTLKCILSVFENYYPDELFQGYYVIFYNILATFVLPFIVLLALYSIVLNELWLGYDEKLDRQSKREIRSITKLVTVILTVFVLTYIVKPIYVVDIYYFDGELIRSIVQRSCIAYYIVNTLTYAMPALNAVVNFYVYLVFRKSFREEIRSCLTCKSPDQEDGINRRTIELRQL